jgi:hypothetical protein
MTQKITSDVNKWANTKENNQPQDPITESELNIAIKKLKKGQSCGPDEIRNKAFIMANRSTRLIYVIMT